MNVTIVVLGYAVIHRNDGMFDCYLFRLSDSKGGEINCFVGSRIGRSIVCAVSQDGDIEGEKKFFDSPT